MGQLSYQKAATFEKLALPIFILCLMIQGMRKTTSPQTQSPAFTPLAWNRLTGLTALAFRLNADEEARLRESKTARLIAAIPYLAGCQQAERTALSHLATYILSCRNGTRWVFDHTPDDNLHVMTRLSTIMSFQEGDQSIIKRGMSLLALQMVCGYARDIAKDAVTGEYNPLLAAAWNADELINSLKLDILSICCPSMDMIMTAEEAQNYWWNV
jgi:hypothetical protein